MRRVLITLLLVGAGAAIAFFLNRPAARAPAGDSGTSPRESSSRPASAGRDIQSPSTDDPDAGVADMEPQPFFFDLGELDFEALEKRTPDNLYWLTAVPTKDPAVLEARAREREERNRQYGKVVSNSATVEEINAYYAYREKLSEDYIEVLQLILDEHGDELSERDSGLFELTISMHAARLSEIPAKRDDALRRKAEYDEVKKAWREQQREETESAP